MIYWRFKNFNATFMFERRTIHFHSFSFFVWNKKNVRMCFYVNTKLNVNNWSIDFVFSNMCTWKLNLNNQRIVNIHNVYSVSWMFYASNASLFIIEMTQNRFVIDEQHVLFKDFNLHHFLWNNSLRSTQHTIID